MWALVTPLKFEIVDNAPYNSATDWMQVVSPELGEEDDKRIAALVGVAPFAHDSGESSKPRHARGGRVEVRNVLYMAAVTASQHNPVLAPFYARLRAAGKPANVCLLAVMRKLIVVLNRMLKDPNFTLVS